MEGDLKAELKKAPPYVSFTTFSNALSTLIEHGVPPQIDRSVLKQFSGLNQSLLFTAFRFMGLTNDRDEPTKDLLAYEAADSENRKVILAGLLKERYPEQVKSLHNGTPQMLKNSFDNISVEPSVRKKCISFFLQSAKSAGLPISTHILRGARGTRGPRKEGDKKLKDSKGRAGSVVVTGGTGEEVKLPKDMVQVPISVGIDKAWTVIMPQNYTKDDLDRFVQIVQITLGKK